MAGNTQEIIILSSDEEDADKEKCQDGTQQCLKFKDSTGESCRVVMKHERMKVLMIQSSSESDNSESHTQKTQPKRKYVITEDSIEEDEDFRGIENIASGFVEDEKSVETSSCNEFGGGDEMTPIWIIEDSETESQRDQNQSVTKDSFQFSSGASSSKGPKKNVEVDDDFNESVCLILDDADSTCLAETQVHSNKSKAPNSIKKLLSILKIKLEDEVIYFKTVAAKIWKEYEVLCMEPMELLDKLSKKLDRSAQEIRNLPEGVSVWEHVDDLLDYFNVEKLREKDLLEDETEYSKEAKQRYDDAVRKKIVQLEEILDDYNEKIKNLDEQEIDFCNMEDENNSAYLQRDRMIAKYMKTYYLLCSIQHSSNYTDRPIEKRIPVYQITAYPELDNAVEKFVNSTDLSFGPDFWNFVEIAKQENVRSSLHLSEQLVIEQAAALHQYVVKKIKARRDRDLWHTLPSACKKLSDDPAETDPELERKLHKNRLKGLTVQQVIRKYAVCDRNLPREFVNEDENVDASPPPSDDDEEDDEDDTTSEEDNHSVPDDNPKECEGHFDGEIDKGNKSNHERLLDKEKMDSQEASPPKKTKK